MPSEQEKASAAAGKYRSASLMARSQRAVPRNFSMLSAHAVSSACTDESLAGRRGALVALATYVIFSMEVAALSFEPFEAGMDAFMYSLLVSGWVVFPVSFLAGILAFRAREGAYRYKHHAEA